MADLGIILMSQNLSKLSSGAETNQLYLSPAAPGRVGNQELSSGHFNGLDDLKPLLLAKFAVLADR